MWDYSQTVMEHYRNPRNVGKIDDADAIGTAGSLSCGDSLKLYLKIKDGIITEAKFQTFGCGSAVASSSILTEMVKGKTLEEVKKITNKDIVEALGGLPPEKMHCSVMGHEALEDALKNYYHEDLSKADDKIICNCFSVSKNQILESIKENNLKTVEEITNYTKAGGACGFCKEQIQAILDSFYHQEKAVKKLKLSPAQKVLKINKIIETEISSELQKDGGDITLIDIDENKVYVKLQGRCSGCKNSDLTLKNFVEKTLKDSVDNELEVIEV